MTSTALVADLKRHEGYAKRLPDGRCEAYPDPLSPLAKALALPVSKRAANWQSYSGSPWTIGYGHTGLEVRPGTIWTQAEADAVLLKDIEEHNAVLDRVIPWWRKLDPVRQDAVANLHFNLGWDNPRTPELEGLAGFTRTLPKIKAGDWDGAARGLETSLWARQTKTRAVEVIAMIRTGKRTR